MPLRFCAHDSAEDTRNLPSGPGDRHRIRPLLSAARGELSTPLPPAIAGTISPLAAGGGSPLRCSLFRAFYQKRAKKEVRHEAERFAREAASSPPASDLRGE